MLLVWNLKDMKRTWKCKCQRFDNLRVATDRICSRSSNSLDYMKCISYWYCTDCSFMWCFCCSPNQYFSCNIQYSTYRLYIPLHITYSGRFHILKVYSARQCSSSLTGKDRACTFGIWFLNCHTPDSLWPIICTVRFILWTQVGILGKLLDCLDQRRDSLVFLQELLIEEHFFYC